MASLFKEPKVPEAPKEDPAIAAAREEEQRRAEEERIRSTQEQLRTETRLRSRRRGFGSLFGLASGNRIRSLLGAG